MGLMSAELLDVIAQGKTVVPLVDFTIGSTTYRYTWGAGVASANLGMYKSQIVEGGFGKFNRGVSIQGRAIQSIEQAVTIWDQGRTLRAAIEGADAVNVRGSSVTCRLAAPGIDYDKYFTWLSGIIVFDKCPLLGLAALRHHNVTDRDLSTATILLADARNRSAMRIITI